MAGDHVLGRMLGRFAPLTLSFKQRDLHLPWPHPTQQEILNLNVCQTGDHKHSSGWGDKDGQ
jgi:hypothetical protein